MDLLQSWEVYDLYNSLQYADSPQWELTRWLMYVVALVNSRKHLNVTDMLKFPWDEEKTAKNTTISNEDIKRLKEKARMIEKDLFNGKANI